MKFLMAVFTFILTLGLTIEAVSSEPEAICTTQNTAKCPQPTDAHAVKSAHKDQSTEMNSLFPEKQKNAILTARPATVELTAPKFLSKVTGEVKLEWKAVPGSNTYHIQVATDPNFKWIVAQEQFVKTTTFNFAKTEAGQKYYWRVAAFNTDNESMYTKSNFSSSVFVTK